MPDETLEALHARIAELEAERDEAQGALEAIRTGQVESLVIEGPDGPRIFSLEWSTYSYRVLVEAISEGAVTFGDDGIVLYGNARLAQMVKAPLEQVMGNPLRRWVPKRLWPALEELLQSASNGGGRVEACLLASDGVEVPALLSVSAIHTDDRRIFCLLATALDAKRGVVPGGIPVDASQVRSLTAATEQFEKDYLLGVLALTKGDQERCAELLGLSPRRLSLRFQEHGITGSNDGK